MWAMAASESQGPSPIYSSQASCSSCMASLDTIYCTHQGMTNCKRVPPRRYADGISYHLEEKNTDYEFQEGRGSVYVELLFSGFDIIRD